MTIHIKYKLTHASGTTQYIEFDVDQEEACLDPDNITEDDIRELVNEHFESTVYPTKIKFKII